jgi:AraC-like DNA-binding protein
MIEFLDGTRETVMYPEHFGIRLYMNDKAVDYPVHWHSATELIMPIDNIYTAVIDDTRYLLEPGEILIIPPGELHELFAPPTGRRMILQFDTSQFTHMNGFDSTLAMLRPCTHLCTGRDDELLALLRPMLNEIMNEYFGASPLREAQAYALLIQFLVTLGRKLLTDGRPSTQTEPAKRRKDIERFMRVCRYIREHCTEDISAEDAAREAGLSKFHFVRMFKQFTGVSFLTYLNRERIHIAEALLTEPNVTITEVAMRSGFGSLATFNRVFKEYKKCTPSQYKLLHGQHIHP